LATLNDTVSDYRIQSDTLAAGIISLRSESASINASIHAVSGSSPAVLDGVQALSPLIETESTKISSQIHHDGQILRQNISYLEKQIDDSFLSQKSQLERIESHLVYRFQEDKRLRRLEEILAGLELTDLPRRQVSPKPPCLLKTKSHLLSSMTVPHGISVVLLQNQTI
jgi:hypothetical protein